MDILIIETSLLREIFPMKTKKIMNSFLCVLSFITSSIAFPSENETFPVAISQQEDLTQAQASLNVFIQECIKNLTDQINNLGILLEDLQQIIANNGVAMSNKHKVVGSIKKIRMILEHFNDQAHLYTRIEEIAFLNHVISSITKHIKEALKQDFTQLKDFDIESCITRGISRLSDEQDLIFSIEASMKKNDTELDLLKKKAETIGLSSFNKAYRFFDDQVIQRGQKWNILSPAYPWIGTNTYFFLAAAGLATTLAYLLADEVKTIDELKIKYNDKSATLSDNLNYYTRYYLGYRPRQTLDSTTKTYQEICSNYPTYSLGKLDQVLASHSSYFLTFFMGAISAPGQNIWKKWCSGWDKAATYLVNKAKGGVHKDNPTGGRLIIPKTTLDDLIGLAEVKIALSPLISLFTHPETTNRAKRAPELGYLLTGDARTGKTFTVECLAGSIKAEFEKMGRDPNEFHFFSLSASDLAKFTINEILQDAKSYAPCIVFIDEIDLLGLQRINNAQKLSEFLIALNDCFKSDPTKPVVVIAATNRPENLDFALRQQGRLGKEITYEYPKVQNRREFLLRKIGKVAVDPTKFDIERLVLETEGCSYEDINILICNAFIEARLHNEPLQQKYIDRAFDRKLRRILLHDDAVLSQDELQLYAAHIAGQALATELLCHDQQVAKATILPYTPKTKEENQWTTLQKDKQEIQQKIKHGKVFTHHIHDTNEMGSRDSQLQKMKALLAGFVAEELLLGAPSGYGYNTEDSHKATAIAFHLASKGGNKDIMTNEQKNMYSEKAMILKTQCEAEILELLTQYRPALETIMNALMTKKIISGAEIKQLINTAMKNKSF